MNATGCEKSKAFLWDLLEAGLIEGDSVQAKVVADRLYNQSLKLDVQIEAEIVDYQTHSRRESIARIALACLNDHCFSPNQQALLTAAMVIGGYLDVCSAAAILERLHCGLEDSTITRAVETAWHVQEDKRDGYLQPHDDSMLYDALVAIIRDYSATRRR